MPRPLDAARLDELALAYVARFAASGAKLESYLKRKLRERGWEGEGEPPLPEILTRFVRAGYVDDAAYARMKAGSMRRRGLGERRIGQQLGADGIGEEDRAAVRAGEGEQRRAALLLARRKRLGPFGPELDRPGREKQLAAMLRAGHRMDMARAVIHAADIATVEAWAAECEEDE
jgi:regulatory protein